MKEVGKVWATLLKMPWHKVCSFSYSIWGFCYRWSVHIFGTVDIVHPFAREYRRKVSRVVSICDPLSSPIESRSNTNSNYTNSRMRPAQPECLKWNKKGCEWREPHGPCCHHDLGLQHQWHWPDDQTTCAWCCHYKRSYILSIPLPVTTKLQQHPRHNTKWKNHLFFKCWITFHYGAHLRNFDMKNMCYLAGKVQATSLVYIRVRFFRESFSFFIFVRFVVLAL